MKSHMILLSKLCDTTNVITTEMVVYQWHPDNELTTAMVVWTITGTVCLACENNEITTETVVQSIITMSKESITLARARRGTESSKQR